MYHDDIDDDDTEGTTPFVMMPRWLLEHPDVSPTALRLYLVLATFTDRRGQCFPRKATLAERFGCTEQTVDLRLRELRDAGAVKVEARWRANGGRASNLYTLAWVCPFPPDGADPPTEPPRPPASTESAASRPEPLTTESEGQSEQGTAAEAAPAVAPPPNELPPGVEAVVEAVTPHPTKTSPPAHPLRTPPPTIKNHLELEPLVSTTLTRGTHAAPTAASVDLPKHRHPDAASKPPRPRNLLWDAVAEACGWDGPLTKAESGRLAAAVKQLRDVGATPDDVHRRAVAYRVTWPSTTLTPTALVANWSTLATSVERLQEQRSVGDRLRGRGESAVDRVRRRMMGSEA